MAAQTTYGEYATAHGRAPMSRQGLSERFGKLPDGLVVRGSVVDWVGVEASAKPLVELKNVLRAAVAYLGSSAEIEALRFEVILLRPLAPATSLRSLPGAYGRGSAQGV